VPIARHFTAAQRTAFGAAAIECPIVAMDTEALAKLFAENDIDVVINCIGVLQDGHRGSTDKVHRDFVARLVTSVGTKSTPRFLIHISIPGNSEDDATPFSKTKRAAEHVITAGAAPFLILRPGFVIARPA